LVIVIFVLLVIVPQHVTPLYVTDEVWLLQIVLEEFLNTNDRKKYFCLFKIDVLRLVKCLAMGKTFQVGDPSLVITTPAGSLDD